MIKEVSHLDAAEDIYAYGNNSTYQVARLSTDPQFLSRNYQDPTPLSVKKLCISYPAYIARCQDINDSWDVLQDVAENRQTIEDKPTRKTSEIAIANTDADLKNGVDIEMSTFSSSISGNAGNAVELAEHSALHPDRQRLYIASFGNGKSSYWDGDERRYIKRTGRFIDPEGQPLPTVAALARMLGRLGIEQAVPVRFSTDSAGGAYATALMHALPEGQVTHGYLKSRPNISNHRLRLAWGLRVLAGDMLDDRQFKQASLDEYAVDKLVAYAKLNMPRIYSEHTSENVPATIPEANKTHGMAKVWNDMIALSRGGNWKTSSPAALDTGLAICRQPEALLTYHFPTHDRLYKNYGDIISFMGELRNKFIGRAAFGNYAEALIVPGAHRDHSSYPTLRGSMEAYAFSRTLSAVDVGSHSVFSRGARWAR